MIQQVLAAQNGNVVPLLEVELVLIGKKTVQPVLVKRDPLARKSYQLLQLMQLLRPHVTRAEVLALQQKIEKLVLETLGHVASYSKASQIGQARVVQGYNVAASLVQCALICNMDSN